MRFDRMSGLDVEQLDELEELISDLLEEPWDRGKGHPRELTLHEALIVASGYARNNIIEEIWAEIFDVNQSTISRYISFLLGGRPFRVEFLPWQRQGLLEHIRGGVDRFEPRICAGTFRKSSRCRVRPP